MVGEQFNLKFACAGRHVPLDDSLLMLSILHPPVAVNRLVFNHVAVENTPE